MAAAIVHARDVRFERREHLALRSRRSSDEGNKSERSRKQPDHREPSQGWWRALLVAFLAGALTIVVFWPASRGGFVWDDAGLITTRHDTLDDWSDVPAAFGRAATVGEGVAYYRPIMIGTFVVDAKLFGLEAPVFHRTNVVLHGLNVALVLLVLVAYGCHLWAAAIAALLFGLHPLQCQAVALILGRNDVLLVPPIALMLVADEVVRRSRRPRLADALVVLGFALTLWTKETGLVAPIFLVVLDVLWRGKPWHALRERLPLGIALGVVTALYFATRLAVIGAFLDTGVYGYIPPLDRPALATAILGYYVRHAFLPWGSAPAPYHPGLVDPSRPELWMAAAFVLTFVGLTAFALRHQRRVACGLVLFATALLPVLALGAQMKVLILDHRTYLAMMGLTFSVGAWRLAVDTVAGRCIAGLVLALLASATYARLPSYGDSVSLWKLGVEAAPSSDYAHNNYGAALMDADHFPEAVAQLREALRLNPAYDKARFNLAGCVEYLGDRPQAIRELEVLLERRPDDLAVLNRLALMRSRGGDLAGAQAAWEHAVTLKPNDPTMVRNLADVLDQRGDSATAVPLRRRLTELVPDKPVSWIALGRSLSLAGQGAEAAQAYEHALTLGPESGALRSALAQALWQAGRWDEAAAQVRRARELGVVDPALVRRLQDVGIDVP
jgi:protein O-mannosyl-transferase